MSLQQSAPLWRKIQRENFTNLPDLAAYLELSPILQEKLLQTPDFPLNLPRRIAEKMEKNTLDDPLFRQFVPLKQEALLVPGFVSDPVCDQSFRKTPKLLQKYKGRALILSTSACAMHCRFCFRQNFPYETAQQGFKAELSYLEEHGDIDEVILSGGDPLSLSDAALEEIFSKLEAIPHIRRIRFHSRFPIGIPERIDAGFASVLTRSSKQLLFVLHCNHSQEIDADIAASLKRLQALGIPTLNQSVLLKGVNDTEADLLALCEILINIGVIPYYLHLLDPVKGTHHFAVSKQRALELIRFVQENTSGFAVPRLVQEEPGQLSKTPVL